MGDQVSHRGPDATGYYVDSHVGMVHKRLSIIDISGGMQPMLSRDEQTALVFNGEIFNFVELRKELERKGVRFRTNSDTEVVLELYLTYGLKFLDKLNGQFAIVLWDKKAKTLYLIRDRIGICPLFYTHDGRSLVFGSEIKAILPALPSTPSISLSGLDEIFTFWASIGSNTVFEGISQVNPGEILAWKGGKLEKHVYWDWPVPHGEFNDSCEDELVERLNELLIDATRIRLRADVAVGAYLSGGLDSSSIVSLVLNHSDNRLRTFSLTFADDQYDESIYQNELINHSGVEHSSLKVGNADIAANFAESIWHCETPILRSAPVPMGMLSRHVNASGYKVVLTGEGADEALGGYDIFKEAKVRQFWARQPESSFRPLLLKRLYPYLRLPKGSDAKYLKRFFGAGLENPNSLGFSHLPRWATTSKAKVFFSEETTRGVCDINAVDRYVGSLPRHLQNSDPFNVAQYIEAKTLMGAYLLSSQGDRMLMKNSVEGRFPFLDHRVIEFAATIPPRLKMKVLNEKYLLKKAMAKDLPQSILSRHKQPYRAPDSIGHGLQRGNADFAAALSAEAVKSVGIFDAKKVELLKKKSTSRRELSVSESQALTGILSTQIVHEMFCKRYG